jgi:NADH-quinone oxidoreductase subunit N
MLAYATMSHVGFILLGILSGTNEGISGAMFYTVIYVIMAAGAFGMVVFLSRAGFEAEQLEDFKGLNARSPWFALMMLMVMFSMAGVPPLAGFYAKLVVLGPLVDVQLTWLAVVAVVFSVIGAFYYLRVVWFMYFVEPADNTQLAAGVDLRFAVSVNGLALLLLGLFPGGLLDLCARVLG